MTESTIWYHYRPLAPLRAALQDDDTRVLARVPVNSQLGVSEVALIGDARAAESIRVKIRHPTREFSEEQSRIIMRLTGHMLTCLRVVHEHNAELGSIGGQFMAIVVPGDGDGRPTLNMRLEHLLSTPKPFPTEDVQATFSQTFDRHDLFDLMADSQRATVPLQYQYLSLFKILEHEFQVGGQWGGRLREFLAPHDVEFKKMDAGNRSLHSEVHDLRDKAAHIRIGKVGAPGLAGLGSRDLNRVSRLMPLLRRIVMDHLISRYNLKRV